MKTPVLVINLKVYEQVLGHKPIEFAKIAKKVSEKNDVNIVIAPPDSLLNETAAIVPTVSQHLDPCEPGACTGSLIPRQIKELGCIGALINHSEKRIQYEDIRKGIDMCREQDLVSIVCAKDKREAGMLATFKPDFIAVEPPELIGGDISVSTAKPEVIKESVDAVKKISPETQVLCGAGVKTEKDVRKSIELGAVGVLVASGVVKAVNIEQAMENLVEGMK